MNQQVSTVTVAAPVSEVFSALLERATVRRCLPGLLNGDGGTAMVLRTASGPVRYRVAVSPERIDGAAGTVDLHLRLTGEDGDEPVALAAHVRAQAAGEGTDLEVELEAPPLALGGPAERQRLLDRLLRQFGANLEALLLASLERHTEESGAPEPSRGTPAAAGADTARDEALAALLATARPLLGRAAPVLAGLLSGWLLGRMLFGRRRRGERT